MSEDKKMIYLDNAATTRTDPKVVEAMLPYFTEYYGNPSSVYEFSGISKKAVTDAREILARSIGAKTQEIYVTAGGSESDNWATKAATAVRAKPSLAERLGKSRRMRLSTFIGCFLLAPGWSGGPGRPFA